MGQNRMTPKQKKAKRIAKGKEGAPPHRSHHRGNKAVIWYSTGEPPPPPPPSQPRNRYGYGW